MLVLQRLPHQAGHLHMESDMDTSYEQYAMASRPDQSLVSEVIVMLLTTRFKPFRLSSEFCSSI